MTTERTMSLRPNISLLITDMDNTLYDWVSYFVPAFYEMVDTASDILRVDLEQLLDELQQVHQRYHNSEQPFALLEAPSVERAFPGTSRQEKARLLDEAFYAFNKMRRRTLALYPNVQGTLGAVRDTGAIVVAHTEAKVANSMYRFLLLDLKRYIHAVYTPQAVGLGHPDPSKEDILNNIEHVVRLLPYNHRKPSPDVIKDIAAEYSVPVDATLYVGDSITRDVYMAKRAGARAAWARYGVMYEKELWPKLVRVTHWTAEDVEQEMQLREEAHNIKPDIELDAFSELLEYFNFVAP